jgi:hypothetical protein
MGMNRGLLSILILIGLVMQASSQGYLGTVNTGTGIEAPITVGSGATPQGANVGASAAVNLTGTMSLNLVDGIARQINLDIIQNGDLLLGYGNMTSGTGIQRVTAAGSLMTNGMMLYILPADVPEVYRLNIGGSGTSLSGRYQAFAANGAAWSGTVTGISDQILDYRQATTLGSGASAGSQGSIVGQPVGVLAQPIGQSAGVMSQPIDANNLGRNRSFFSSSNGQTTMTDGTTTTTTSDGTTTTTTSDGTTSISYG